VSTLAFRAQLAVPQPRPQPPRKLTLSGPSETPETRPSTSLPAPEPHQDDPLAAAMPGARRMNPPRQQLTTNRDDGDNPPQQPASSEKTVGRNDPCPCGSGRKYKKCHGVGAT
jgi:preprotein translocase subunit SecA